MVDMIQAELRAPQLKTYTLQTSMIQVQTPSATSSATLVTMESHLVPCPPNLGMQV